jgi:hypothetical protein
VVLHVTVPVFAVDWVRRSPSTTRIRCCRCGRYRIRRIAGPRNVGHAGWVDSVMGRMVD